MVMVTMAVTNDNDKHWPKVLKNVNSFNPTAVLPI